MGGSAVSSAVAALQVKPQPYVPSASGLLQRKLAINASNDPLEQEADRVADQMLAMPANPTVSGAPPRIQRYTGRAFGETGTAPASVDRVLASPGRPLDSTLQQDMGQRFGHDFSRVRVHSGAAAAQSARDVNAHAYTVGHSIVFGAGQLAPGTRGGARLLAHELTHVLQQTGSAGIVQRDLAVEPQGVDKTERALTPADIVAAIAFNAKHLKDKKLLRLVRDVLGIAPDPAVSDRDLALGVARWQASHGVSQDGKLGQTTLMVVAAEFRAEGLDPEAESAKKVFSKGVVVDVDANFCGCEQELRDEIKGADHMIGEYTACGADPAVTNGNDVEDCIKRRAGGALTTLASTSATSGAITMKCQRTGPCKDLLCTIDNAHEQIHSVHVRELRQKHGGGAALNSAVLEKTDWVADEVASRNTDKSLSLWALSVLDRTCP